MLRVQFSDIYYADKKPILYDLCEEVHLHDARLF